MKTKSEPINIPKVSKVSKEDYPINSPRKYQELVESQRAQRLMGLASGLPKK